MRKTLIAKYADEVLIAAKGECWGWAGRVHKHGYGEVSHNNKVVRAHRIAYQFYKAAIPKGMDVMHTCHNPACSNPDHLEIGTRKENMKTSFIAGRLQRKIPLTDMPMIAARRACGETLSAIAAQYGCTKQAIRHMLKSHPEQCYA